MTLLRSQVTAVARCDCCGGTEWQACFTDGGFTLGRCAGCGLHAIHPMPPPDSGSDEHGAAAGPSPRMLDAEAHRRGEYVRRMSLSRLLDLIGDSAPPGPWLELGCGTGTMLGLIRGRGYEVEGIEPAPDRRAAAIETGCVVHAEPLEALALPAGRYAAILGIDVFSHLASPAAMFAAAAWALRPDGILFLRTGEIVGRVRRRDAFHWNLGEHRYWLGEGTIDRYAAQAGFRLERRVRWTMAEIKAAREVLEAPGRSRARNTLKRIILAAPGGLPLFRAAIAWRFRGGALHYGAFLLRRAG